MDWNKLEVEYITTATSQKKLSDKYGVSIRTIAEYAKKHEWTAKRREYCTKTVSAAVKRTSKLEALDLSKEIEIVHALSDVMTRSLLDNKQFNRYLVEETEYDDRGFPVKKTTVEKKYKKTDMRAVKDAATAMTAIEKMRRSMETILTYQEKEELKMARKRLKLEERKVDAMEKAGEKDIPKDETGLIMIDSVEAVEDEEATE